METIEQLKQAINKLEEREAKSLLYDKSNKTIALTKNKGDTK